jgi:hypothetical protein
MKKRPKPLVIDRYHFKQDIEGYLTTDSRPGLLYIYEMEGGKLDKLTTDKMFKEGKGHLVSRWYPGGLYQQP